MEPHWTSYVGMITGGIGAITGMIGAILGFLGYRKSSSLKQLDLRLEFRRMINEVESDASSLKDLMEKCDKSRKYVLSAIGQLRSSSMDLWVNQIAADRKSLEEISEKIPDRELEYHSLSTKDLEVKLVELHRLQVQLETLLDKYEEELAQDDEERRMIREDHRSI